MTGFGWKEEIHSIWAEEEHWDDFLQDPKNKVDYAWFRNHTCHWAPAIEELLGPRLATGNHAHTAQSARIAAEEAAKSNPNRRPLVPLADTEDATIEDFLDQDGNIQRHLFPNGTLFPGDGDYDHADDPFSDLYAPSTSAPTPKPSSSSTPTPNQLHQASALKRHRAQGREKNKRAKVSAGASLSGATVQIADIMGETLAWRKEEFDMGRPEYQRAMDIVYATCQDLVDALPIRAQIALPGFVKAAIPRMLGSAKTSYATYILDAQAGPTRRFFIKKMLKDHQRWLVLVDKREDEGRKAWKESDQRGFYSTPKDLIEAFNAGECEGDDYDSSATGSVFEESGPEEN